MGLILTADDVTPGRYVAVHSERRAAPVAQMDAEPMFPRRPADTCHLPVPPGVPLRVLGVSLPFAACAILEPGGSESGPVVLDLRRVHVSRLDAAFVTAIASFRPEGEEAGSCAGGGDDVVL